MKSPFSIQVYQGWEELLRMSHTTLRRVAIPFAEDLKIHEGPNSAPFTQPSSLSVNEALLNGLATCSSIRELTLSQRMSIRGEESATSGTVLEAVCAHLALLPHRELESLCLHLHDKGGITVSVTPDLITRLGSILLNPVDFPHFSHLKLVLQAQGWVKSRWWASDEDNTAKKLWEDCFGVLSNASRVRFDIIYETPSIL
ncbi:hypothetical protein C8Q80DRAFT_1136013 [Daedaleopsis nitida]|nr:hypothetical protein C8Q80DRAFT_1136013 [Daedaleopsis nitida]